MGLPVGVAIKTDDGGDVPRWPISSWRAVPSMGQPTGAGMAARRGAAGQPFRNTQQSERAGDRGQVSPGDVEIPCGRIDGAVAEQELDGGQIHPGFQQMRGKTMPERISTLLIIRR